MKRGAILVIILSLIIISGCSEKDGKKVNATTDDPIYKIKVTACYKADEAGTCYTKLPKLGIISPRECCEQMDKCCRGEG